MTRMTVGLAPSPCCPSAWSCMFKFCIPAAACSPSCALDMAVAAWGASSARFAVNLS